MKKKIAIIGGGIAGLTLGNLIKKKSDIEFMIYEKEENLPLEGFGIQLSINSVSILNEIGFKNINSKEVYHPSNLDFYSIKNERICNIDIAKFNSKETKYTTLQRSTLIDFLKDEIYTQHLRFGKRIQRISEIKDKLLINFDDNTNDLVDHLIAADGVFSHTRSFFETKKSSPKFVNAIVIRKILKSSDGLNINSKNISLLMGSNAHIVVYPINKKNELNLVCILREKKFDPDNIKLIIEKKILSQNQNLKDFFQGDLKSWPLYITQKILPSKNRKVFYLGDAFYGFLPTMAQGASQSIEGAFELFKLFKENNKDVSNIYFKKRLERTKLIKKRSELNYFVFHISNSMIRKIRNIILKFLVKRKDFISNYLGKVYKN